MITQAKCHYKRCQEAVCTPPGPAQGCLQSSAEHNESHRAVVSTWGSKGAGGQHLECVQVVAPPSLYGGHGFHSQNGDWREQWGTTAADPCQLSKSEREHSQNSRQRSDHVCESDRNSILDLGDKCIFRVRAGAPVRKEGREAGRTGEKGGRLGGREGGREERREGGR